MPTFKFHVSGDPIVVDAELETLAAAKCAAIQFAAAIICEDAGARFWEHEEWTMTVTDGHDLALFEITVIGTDAPVTRASARASA